MGLGMRAGGLDPTPEEASLVSSDWEGVLGLSFRRLGQEGLQDWGRGQHLEPGSRGGSGGQRQGEGAPDALLPGPQRWDTHSHPSPTR